MSAAEIDRYLLQFEELRRTTLQQLRGSMPRWFAGFAAFKRHLSYLPHSGSVLDELGGQLAGYTMTKGSLHFPADEPLPDRLVGKLVTVRLRQIRTSQSRSQARKMFSIDPPGESNPHGFLTTEN